MFDIACLLACWGKIEKERKGTGYSIYLVWAVVVLIDTYHTYLPYVRIDHDILKYLEPNCLGSWSKVSNELLSVV